MNQAAAAYSTAPENRKLLRFVYKHALEELGHEQMVVHDLKSINLYNEGFENHRPLPAIQALISYLYKVALDKGAVARLGYSYWAENCYGHIDPLLRKFSNDLNLTKNNMSFSLHIQKLILNTLMKLMKLFHLVNLQKTRKRKLSTLL